MTDVHTGCTGSINLHRWAVNSIIILSCHNSAHPKSTTESIPAMSPPEKAAPLQAAVE
jgi:hypothetical protein